MASHARSVNSFWEIFFCAPPGGVAWRAAGPRRKELDEKGRPDSVGTVTTPTRCAENPQPAGKRPRGRAAVGVATWDAIIAGIAAT